MKINHNLSQESLNSLVEKSGITPQHFVCMDEEDQDLWIHDKLFGVSHAGLFNVYLNGYTLRCKCCLHVPTGMKEMVSCMVSYGGTFAQTFSGSYSLLEAFNYVNNQS